MSEINDQNYNLAVAAIRDILYMYYDLITSYERFGHSIEIGSFDPQFFVDCYLNEPEGYTFGINVDLLHEGSAVAILCQLSDFWFDYETAPSGKFASEIEQMLSEGRLDHLPLAEEAIEIGLRDEERFRDILGVVYQEYF